MATLLVVASLSGNTKTFIDFVRSNISDELIVDDQFSSSIEDYDKIIIGSYSWGSGRIPKKLKQYLIDNQHYFQNKKVFIYGSGNSIYPKFCGAVDGIEKITTDCGANIIGRFRYEQRFNQSDFTEEELAAIINDLREFDY